MLSGGGGKNRAPTTKTSRLDEDVTRGVKNWQKHSPSIKNVETVYNARAKLADAKQDH